MTKWDWEKLKQKFPNENEEDKKESNMKPWEKMVAVPVFLLFVYGCWHAILKILSWFQ